MKTIEERATDYACDDGVMPDSSECESCFNIYGKCTRDAYIAGAMAEHKELARWHDPKEELPPAEKIVLVKSTYGCGYALAERDDEGWWLAPPEEWELPADRVIGWREIYE